MSQMTEQACNSSIIVKKKACARQKLTPSLARVSFQSAGLVEQDEADHHCTVWIQSRTMPCMH